MKRERAPCNSINKKATGLAKVSYDFLESEYMETDLKSQIKSSRKVSIDGTNVTYDMTNGVDFSKPRKTAEALAEALFEEDVSKWITYTSGELTVSPTQKIEILITSDHSKKVDKTVEEFKKDLEKNEMGSHYADAMEKAATYKAGIGTYMFAGLIGAMIVESSNRNAEGKEYLDKVFQKVMNNVEIKKIG